jgi:hypothetical protein
MGFFRGPQIVKDGLILAIDAGSIRSYSGVGTTWYDLSRNGNNLTINGTPTFTTGNPSSFNLSSSQSSKYFIKNPFSHPNGDVTYECWVKFGSTTLTGALLSYATSGNDNNSLLFFNSGTLNLYGPTGSVASSWTIPNTTTWYQIVRTRVATSGAEILYINGVSTYTTTLAVATNFTSGGSLVIGQEQDSVGGGFDSAQCFIGDVGVIKIYNRTLTPLEVTQNYNTLKKRFNL